MDKDKPGRIRLLRMMCNKEQWDEFRQFNFTVGDLMSSPPITVESQKPLRVALEFITSKHVHHIIVIARGKLIGIISDRDILKALRHGNIALSQETIKAATIKPKVASPDMPIEESASIMLASGISSLPVVNDDNEPIGIVTSTDHIWLLKLLQMANAGDVQKITQYLMREIRHLSALGRILETEADELTSSLLTTVGTSLTNKPSTS